MTNRRRIAETAAKGDRAGQDVAGDRFAVRGEHRADLAVGPGPHPLGEPVAPSSPDGAG